MTAKTKVKPLAISPASELLAFAREARKSAKSWEDLHNAIYGIGGQFAKLFPDQAARTAFAKSDEFKAVSALIGELRGNGVADEFASGKFVLRLPESLHAALVAEAKLEGVSLNQLCLAKLATQLRAIVR